jgi:hypothetical protein
VPKSIKSMVRLAQVSQFLMPKGDTMVFQRDKPSCECNMNKLEKTRPSPRSLMGILSPHHHDV